MKIIQQNLFPTPVWYTMLDHNNQDLINYAEALRGDVLTKREDGGWETDHFINVDINNDDNELYVTYSNVACENKTMLNLIKDVKKICSSILNSVHTYSSLRVVIDNFWIVQIDKKQSYLKGRHSHPGSVLSAVYYMQAEENAGDIVLHTPLPFHHHWWKSFLEKDSLISHQTISYAPAPGKLIIFPSWLEHNVTDNNSNSARLSIAFNIELINTINNRTVSIIA